MDLLKLGVQSRKTGLKPPRNLAKDEHDMESINEYFRSDDDSYDDDADAEEPPSITSRRRRSNSLSSTRRSEHAKIKSNSGAKSRGAGSNTELQNVARKIDFTDAEAESFKLSPIALGSRYSKKDKHKRSPLRSPLQEHQVSKHLHHQRRNLPKSGDDQIDDKSRDISDDSQKLFVDEDPHSPDDFHDDYYDNNIGFNDFDDRENETLSPVPLSAINEAPISPPSDKPEPTSKTSSSLTKRMALGNTSKRKPKSNNRTQKSFGESLPDQLSTFDNNKAISERSARFDSTTSKPKEDIIKPSPLPSPPPDGLRRSRRTKIAPLAFWRNERIVYSRANDREELDPDSTLVSDIRKIPLQEIQSVVHIPDPLASQKQNAATNRKRSRSKSRSTPPKSKRGPKDNKNPEDQGYDYESDPEIDGSQWFKEKVKQIEVNSSKNGAKEVRSIAYAPDGGVFQTPPANKNGDYAQDNYTVATLFDSYRESIAGGLLDFPFEGFKGLRNTTNSTLLCHVVKGLIEVNINDNVFLVTRGCSFEIPRANNYSFRNRGQSSARIFFVQTSGADYESSEDESDG